MEIGERVRRARLRAQLDAEAVDWPVWVDPATGFYHDYGEGAARANASQRI
jgi:hypothetical protein